jgi:predicted histone-like DNA-binding protein
MQLIDRYRAQNSSLEKFKRTLMSVKFSVHDTPMPNGRKGESNSHARLNPQGIKRIDDICEYINESSSLTSADIKAALEAMFNYMKMQMRYGYIIEIENFGHFSVALRTRKVKEEDGKITNQVTINGVNFRCAPRLKKAVRTAQLQRVKKNAPPFPDIEERKSRMLEHLEKSGSISIRRYMRLNSCSQYRATNDIQTFRQEGIILPSGISTHRVYMLAEKEPDE